jgi:hypothetical protein
VKELIKPDTKNLSDEDPDELVSEDNSEDYDVTLKSAFNLKSLAERMKLQHLME